MPRPKRSKVAPSIPAKVQQRVAKPALEPSIEQKQLNIASSESSGRVISGSDDSDGLVMTRKPGAGRRNPAAQLYTMSGALGPEDVGLTRSRPPSGQTRAALSRIVREADHAKASEEKARRGAAAQADPQQILSSIPAKTVAASRPSGNGLGQSFARQSSQETVSRVPETPHFHSSMLGAATFRKRPRQPSLLQMVQAQNKASDSLDEDDMYDFLPDDESTPLIKSLSQPNPQARFSSQHVSGSRKRKLASPEIQVPTSQPLEISSPSAESSHSRPQEDPLVEEDYPEPTLPRLGSTRNAEPQIFDDTLAPPQSSSPPPEPRTRPGRGKATKAPSKAKPSEQLRRRQLSSAPSPLSSTSTQVSPVKPATSKPLTTANLQNLLPKRRVRAKPKGDYDIPSSSDVELDNTGLGEDEDELSFHVTSKIRPKKSMMPSHKSASKSKSQPSKLATNNKAKRVSKTYTRKTAVESDEENDSEDDIISDEGGGVRTARGKSKTPAMEGKAKAEMERLAAKFREVDEFTLDFEDMTGNSSSQMKDAR